MTLDEGPGIPTPEQIIETDNQDAIDSKRSLDEPEQTSTKSTKKTFFKAGFLALTFLGPVLGHETTRDLPIESCFFYCQSSGSG